jgi:hypothetical protein
MIILPSQARDKHWESTRNEMRFSQLHLWLQAAAHSQGGALADKPVFVRAHRWGSGLATEPLGLNEPALSFEPWVGKTAIFEPFIYKMHYFTKTGSGQT